MGENDRVNPSHGGRKRLWTCQVGDGDLRPARQFSALFRITHQSADFVSLVQRLSDDVPADASGRADSE
jgi:hypothetical protein